MSRQRLVVDVPSGTHTVPLSLLGQALRCPTYPPRPFPLCPLQHLLFLRYHLLTHNIVDTTTTADNATKAEQEGKPEAGRQEAAPEQQGPDARPKGVQQRQVEGRPERGKGRTRPIGRGDPGPGRDGGREGEGETLGDGRRRRCDCAHPKIPAAAHHSCRRTRRSGRA